MTPAIANLIAAVRAIGPEAAGVTLHFDPLTVDVRINAHTDESAAVLAVRLGCLDYDLATANGREWPEYRTPNYWASDLRIAVSGPHRAAGERAA